MKIDQESKPVFPDYMVKVLKDIAKLWWRVYEKMNADKIDKDAIFNLLFNQFIEILKENKQRAEESLENEEFARMLGEMIITT